MNFIFCLSSQGEVNRSKLYDSDQIRVGVELGHYRIVKKELKLGHCKTGQHFLGQRPVGQYPLLCSCIFRTTNIAVRRTISFNRKYLSSLILSKVD